jgi:hypothetical protein
VVKKIGRLEIVDLIPVGRELFTGRTSENPSEGQIHKGDKRTHIFYFYFFNLRSPRVRFCQCQHLGFLSSSN